MRRIPTLLTAALMTVPLTSGAQTRVDTVLEGLDYPWDIAPLADGLLLTEKGGFILEVGPDGSFARMVVETSRLIDARRGRGLLGLALAPDYPESGTIYLYHSTRDGSVMSNRVITARREGDVWRETGEVIAGIPGHPLYNGGRIAFGPDGMLYITTGWIEDGDLPQDPASLAGKILRLAPDGSIPAGNPIPGSPVWSIGHRNPQGIAWDAQGRFFAAEHGGGGHDEINLIEPGANYGWPDLQGDDSSPGKTPPQAHSERQTWAPSGIAFDADGRLIVAALRSEGLMVMAPGTDTLGVLADTGIRMRDVAVLHGVIYAITTERSPRGDGPSRDRLIRLTYSD